MIEYIKFCLIFINNEIDDLEKEIKKLQIQTVYKKKVLLISYCFSAAFFSLLFDGKFRDFLVAGVGGVLFSIWPTLLIN